MAGRKQVKGQETKETVDIPLTAAQLQERINRWIEFDYMHTEHGGLAGLTPFQMVTGWTGQIRREDPMQLALLLMEAPRANGNAHGTRIPQSGGIQWEGTYIAPELYEYTGKPIKVLRDDLDHSKIYVYTLDDVFVCVAERTGGMTDERQQQIAREATRLHKGMLRVIKGRKKPEDLVAKVLDHAEAQHSGVVAFPQESYSQQTAALAAAEAAIRAIERAQQPRIQVLTQEEVAYHEAKVTPSAPSEEPEEQFERLYFAASRTAEEEEQFQFLRKLPGFGGLERVFKGQADG